MPSFNMLVNSWSGQYGVDLCLKWSGTDQKGGLAYFASTGARSNQ